MIFSTDAKKYYRWCAVWNLVLSESELFQFLYSCHSELYSKRCRVTCRRGRTHSWIGRAVPDIWNSTQRQSTMMDWWARRFIVRSPSDALRTRAPSTNSRCEYVAVSCRFCLRSDLYCVGWGVKLYSLSPCCSCLRITNHSPSVSWGIQEAQCSTRNYVYVFLQLCVCVFADWLID